MSVTERGTLKMLLCRVVDDEPLTEEHHKFIMGLDEDLQMIVLCLLGRVADVTRGDLYAHEVEVAMEGACC